MASASTQNPFSRKDLSKKSFTWNKDPPNGFDNNDFFGNNSANLWFDNSSKLVHVFLLTPLVVKLWIPKCTSLIWSSSNCRIRPVRKFWHKLETDRKSQSWSISLACSFLFCGESFVGGFVIWAVVDCVQEVQGGQGEDDQDPSPVPEEKPPA